MKNSFKIAACAALGFALCAPSASAQMMPRDMNTSALQTQIGNNFDRLFMIHAAQGNMAEVMMGRLALQKSRNPKVRGVAQMTIQGHSEAQRDLAMHFRAMAVPMPDKPAPAQVALYEKLRRMSGANFDKTYMAQQVGAHEATITLFQHQIEHGKNAVAKQHAINKLPGILMHTAMIYDAAISVGAPSVNLRPRPILEAARDTMR